MITNLNKNNTSEIYMLEKTFPQVFVDNSIITDFTNNPFTKYLIYKKDNKIIGFINYNIIYERAEIVNFNVIEEYQNNGIGNILLQKLIEILRINNINSITLEVRSDNYKAIHLYEKYGFEKKAVRTKYYNDTDGILMEVKMKDTFILGIETSCDETSCSIVKNGTEEISTIIASQIDIHKEYGGVVPEIASREHVKCITYVIEECLKKANMSLEMIDAFAVTYGPGLVGSLLIGVEAAKTLSFLYNKPLIPVHHIEGHIYANNLVKRLEFPLIGLVVSGGHTNLVYMEKDYEIKSIGGTLDDAVGECYDKVARVLDLPYPGGPKIDELAFIGKPFYNLPIPLNDNSYNFSFSGLKSAVINLVNKEKQKGNTISKEDLATSFQNVVIDSLTTKTIKAIKEYKVKNFIIAGGVSANKGLRNRLKEILEKEHINYTFPSINYCTDNATMIASAAYYAYQKGITASLLLNPISSEELK